MWKSISQFAFFTLVIFVATREARAYCPSWSITCRHGGSTIPESTIPRSNSGPTLAEQWALDQANANAAAAAASAKRAAEEAARRHVVVDGKIYEGNAEGVKKYLQELELSDPAAWGALERDYNQIFRVREIEEARQKVKEYKAKTRAPLLLAGAAFFGGAVWGLSELSKSYPEKPNQVGPSALLLGGMVFGLALLGGEPQIPRPGREEIMDFINIHNIKRKKHPMEFKMGFVPTSNGGSVAALMTF